MFASPFRRAASNLSCSEICFNMGPGISIEDGGVSTGEFGTEDDEAESLILRGAAESN